MIQRVPVPINFAKGMDEKTDPKQIPIGYFLKLYNAVFTKGGLLQKRNGFGPLSTLPSAAAYLTTYNQNLIAVGSSVMAYSAATKQWSSAGSYAAVVPSVLPMIRNALNQEQCDSTIAPNGLVCVVYTETDGSNTYYKYTISDSATGQKIQPPTPIPVASGAISGSPRVFIVGSYFVICFTNTISAVAHLQFVAVSYNNPTGAPTANTDIVSTYTPVSRVNWDGVVAPNGNLYVAWNSTSGGQAIKMAFVNPGLVVSAPATVSTHAATVMSLCCDATNPTRPIIWASFYTTSGTAGYVLAVDANLVTVLAPTQIISSGTILNIAGIAANGSINVYYEVSAAYGYDSSIPTNFVNSRTVTQGGVVGSVVTVVRSLGLASKIFMIGDSQYFLGARQSTFQSTYFLINGSTSTQAAPVVVAKLAYENGNGYLNVGLPSVFVQGEQATVAYLYKDLVEALATQNNTQQTATGGVYSQTGINLATFQFGSAVTSAEIGQNLNLGGGFGWIYDGVQPVENNFFLWPEDAEVFTATGSGNLSAQQYFYQFTYEWTDSAGNPVRSAPSVPISITTTTSSSTNTLYIPTLRLTYKIDSPVKIVGYRWSTAQQIYYQFTSILAPTLNTTVSDYVAILDAQSDAEIAGNNIIYTTGGVIEDISPPGYPATTLFDTRQWLVDAEDRNLLWYSKQVIENTPVEWSDLLTIYVAPNTGTTQTTGPILALAPMDDKLILFKAEAIYYINGAGPDNTGSNSQYSQPIFITSTVGCMNPASIVLTQGGLMFQSDKGIWLLGRDLNTTYIGAPVEASTLGQTVTSAQNIPATTQIRFTLSNGSQLMFDYYYSQWGVFVGAPAVSSCIYGGLHTLLTSSLAVNQETPGAYLDGALPVLLAFLTGWLALQGLSGYQRLYELQFLGQYLSPHRWDIQLGYNFGALSEQAIVQPINATGAYGSDDFYGQTSPYGGPTSLEQWRVQPSIQKCQSVQMQLQETYDPSYGAIAGAGFSLSAMTAIIGIIRGYRPVPANQTVGTT